MFRRFAMWKRYTARPLVGTARLSNDGKLRYSVMDHVTLREAEHDGKVLTDLHEEDARRLTDEMNAEDARKRAAGEGPWFVAAPEPGGNFEVKDTRTDKPAIGKDEKPLGT
jgi:hypothetical protein